jgi:hypothetical protein
MSHYTALYRQVEGDTANMKFLRKIIIRVKGIKIARNQSHLSCYVMLSVTRPPGNVCRQLKFQTVAIVTSLVTGVSKL